MDVSLGELIGAGVTLAGLAATWGALGLRVRRVEQDAATKLELQALDTKLEEIRRLQGERLGIVEKKADGLIGKFEGFQAGFATGRRTRTSAHGVPSGGEG
ncbi:MAG TPA: hypothetical protein VNH17_07720 [Streptosporangiaceae bacterium]|nr:hypothetical protein [Streptosporangiaceae bacterium]